MCVTESENGSVITVPITASGSTDRKYDVLCQSEPSLKPDGGTAQPKVLFTIKGQAGAQVSFSNNVRYPGDRRTTRT